MFFDFVVFFQVLLEINNLIIVFIFESINLLFNWVTFLFLLNFPIFIIVLCFLTLGGFTNGFCRFNQFINVFLLPKLLNNLIFDGIIQNFAFSILKFIICFPCYFFIFFTIIFVIVFTFIWHIFDVENNPLLKFVISENTFLMFFLIIRTLEEIAISMHFEVLNITNVEGFVFFSAENHASMFFLVHTENTFEISDLIFVIKSNEFSLFISVMPVS